ncbi:TetR/AcrR family transcriptional regulator [Janibacter sp. GS2]|uniref:TetR/AcrR family transcriptional regulator n=1 Tax=Janibacter sp. GS2 TaxID=3442646 RepID=UPI003EBD0501
MAYVEAAVRRGQIVNAARVALTRDGVARTSMRAVAAEAGVPLGTLQYIFPSRELLLRAVIEDVVEEIAGVLESSAHLDDGLEQAIRLGLTRFWHLLVTDRPTLQLVQYELVTDALRTPGLESLAGWQYQRYVSIVATWCETAATLADEVCAVPFERLARVLVASVDGIILQHICDPDEVRSGECLDSVITMLVTLADTRPARAAVEVTSS